MKQLRLERDGYSNIIIQFLSSVEESLPYMQVVVGSNPTGTTLGDVAQLVEHLPEEQGVVSSILTVTTESRINGKPPLPYGSQSVKLVKWGI